MATLQALQAQIEKLQAKADAVRAKEQKAAISAIHEMMLKHDLTLEDIGNPYGARGRSAKNSKGKTGRAKGKQPPKYMNPKTGETWSGLARPPAWIKDVKDRSKFLINKGDAGGPPTARKTQLKVVKTGAKSKKASVPPKYRDPDSGATWTGRGMAPAWIRDAKDRSKFLIERAAA
ncbi:H-NS family nucleoid-associated regulatory protein [Paraburkholderia sp. A3RO-2L]|uniref:H-NS family nucleoid-associated regulatory protein n=1 Tax=unclassified Paraburkholderia TaxID=2615204 RepID=UPI003DA9C964